MAYTEKRLAALQQLPNAIGDLYTATAVTALLTKILLYNTNTTTETGYIAIYDGSSTYEFWPFELATGETMEIDLKGIVLNASDKIKGVTTTASKVNCYLSGIEKA